MPQVLEPLHHGHVALFERIELDGLVDHLPVLQPPGLVALPVPVRRLEDPDRGLLAQAVDLVGVEDALPFLRIRGQDAGADQDRVGLGGDHEVRPVILRDLRALQHDQELAALAAVRADHAGIRDRPLPEVVDSAAGRPGRHLVHQQAAGVAQLREGDDVGRRVVRGEDRQLLLGGPVDDQVARLAAERAEVRVAPLHDGDRRNEVDVGLHGALVVDLLANAFDGLVGRIAVRFELEHPGAGLLATVQLGVGDGHPRGERSRRTR